MIQMLKELIKEIFQGALIGYSSTGMLIFRIFEYISVFVGLCLYIRDKEWKEVIKYLIFNLVIIISCISCYCGVLPFWCMIPADFILLSHLPTSINVIFTLIPICIEYIVKNIGKET